VENNTIADILVGLKPITKTPDVVLIALAKMFDGKALITGKKLKPGKYPFAARFLVDITGELTKGEDYKMNVSNKIDFCLAFAVALSQVNDSTRNSIYQSIDKILKTSKTKKGQAAIEEAQAKVKAESEEKIAWLKKRTKKKCEGKTTFKDDIITIQQLG
jgi:hypothetical protein